MKKILLALTMCCFLCSSVQQTHAFEISPQTQTIGCGAVAIITSIGTIYCYTKKRAYDKMLEELKPYSPISQKNGPTTYKEHKSYLEKKHVLYKKLTLVAGGITLGVLALASWGGYRWHNSNKCNNFMDDPDLDILTDELEAMKRRWANLSATEIKERLYQYAIEAHILIKKIGDKLSPDEKQALYQAIEIMDRFSPEKPSPANESEINATVAAAETIANICFGHDYVSARYQAFSPEKTEYLAACCKAHIDAKKPYARKITTETTKEEILEIIKQFKKTKSTPATRKVISTVCGNMLFRILPYESLISYEKAYNEGQPLADVLDKINKNHEKPNTIHLIADGFCFTI